MSKKAPKAKYPVGMYVKVVKDNEIAKITDINFIQTVSKGSRSQDKFGVVHVNEWLYDVEFLNPSAPRAKVRYYESVIDVKCNVLLEQVLPKVIYGN